MTSESLTGRSEFETYYMAIQDSQGTVLKRTGVAVQVKVYSIGRCHSMSPYFAQGSRHSLVYELDHSWQHKNSRVTIGRFSRICKAKFVMADWLSFAIERTFQTLKQCSTFFYVDIMFWTKVALAKKN